MFDDPRAVPIQNSDIVNSNTSGTSAFYDAFYDKLWQNILSFFQTIIFFGLTMINEQPWVLHQPYWVARLIIRWRVPENTDSVFIG